MGAVEGVSQRFPRPYPVSVMPNDAPNALKTGAYHILKGDGTDGAELNNLLADRGHVLLGPGTATVVGIAPPAGATLRGSGADTTLFLPNGSNAKLLAAEAANDLLLADFLVDANGAHQSGADAGDTFNILHLSRSDRVRLRNIRILNAKSNGVVALSCDDLLLDRVTIISPYKFGVFVGAQSDKPTRRVTIDGAVVDGSQHQGICVDGGYGLEVSHVLIRDSWAINGTGQWSVLEGGGATYSGNGIHLEQGIRSWKVLGCTAHGNARSGIAVQGGQTSAPCYDGLIAGNISRSNAAAGIDLDLAHSVHLADNRALINAAYGLRCTNGKNLTGENNDWDLNGQHGVYLLDSAYVKLRGGKARANSQSSAGTYDGVRIDDSGAGLYATTDNAVLDLQAYDDQATLTGADASMTAGSATLTLATSRPVPDGLSGKAITVVGAGAAGANLVTTISNPYLSDGKLVLAVAASTTVSGAAWTITRPQTQNYGARIAATGRRPVRTTLDGNDLRGNLQATPFTDAGDLTDLRGNRGLEGYQAVIEEDYLSGANNTAVAIGAAGATPTHVGSGTGVFTTIQGHPGIRRSDTGATANSSEALSLAGNGNVHSNDRWDLRRTLKVNQANSDADAIYRLGILAAVASPVTQGCYFERLGGEANWFAVCTAASVSTRTDTGVAQDTGWHEFRVRRRVDGAICFSIDGGTDTVVSTNVPSGQALFPVTYVANGTAAASKQLDEDRVRLVIQGLARSA